MVNFFVYNYHFYNVHINFQRIIDIYAVPGIDYIPIGTIKNYAKQAVKIEND